MSSTKECIEVCNSLLRGELSALETYDQALEKFAGESAASDLRQIRAEHSESVERLRQNVRSMGGDPSDDSGLWGDFAKTVEGTAKLLGEGAALAALEAGEKHGENSYLEALENDSVMPECKTMIEQELLPRQRKHLQVLQQLNA